MFLVKPALQLAHIVAPSVVHSAPLFAVPSVHTHVFALGALCAAHNPSPTSSGSWMLGVGSWACDVGCMRLDTVGGQARVQAGKHRHTFFRYRADSCQRFRGIPKAVTTTSAISSPYTHSFVTPMRHGRRDCKTMLRNEKTMALSSYYDFPFSDTETHGLGEGVGEQSDVA